MKRNLSTIGMPMYLSESNKEEEEDGIDLKRNLSTSGMPVVAHPPPSSLQAVKDPAPPYNVRGHSISFQPPQAAKRFISAATSCKTLTRKISTVPQHSNTPQLQLAHFRLHSRNRQLNHHFLEPASCSVRNFDKTNGAGCNQVTA